MPAELSDFIRTSPLADTHEHMEYEGPYRQIAPDVLRNLFDSYVVHDLVSAGASEEAPPQLRTDGLWLLLTLALLRLLT